MTEVKKGRGKMRLNFKNTVKGLQEHYSAGTVFKTNDAITKLNASHSTLQRAVDVLIGSGELVKIKKGSYYFRKMDTPRTAVKNIATRTMVEMKDEKPKASQLNFVDSEIFDEDEVEIENVSPKNICEDMAKAMNEYLEPETTSLVITTEHVDPNEEVAKINIGDIEPIMWNDVEYWIATHIAELGGVKNPSQSVYQFINSGKAIEGKHFLKLNGDNLNDFKKGISFKLIAFEQFKFLSQLTVFTEYGLYAYFMWSDCPYGTALQKRIIEEVLPSIRRKGYYAVNEQLEIKPPAKLYSSPLEMYMSGVMPNETWTKMLVIFERINDTISKGNVTEDSKLLTMQSMSKLYGFPVVCSIPTDSKKWFTATELAETIGIYSDNDLPHASAISFIIHDIMKIDRNDTRYVKFEYQNVDVMRYEFKFELKDKFERFIQLNDGDLSVSPIVYDGRLYTKRELRDSLRINSKIVSEQVANKALEFFRQTNAGAHPVETAKYIEDLVEKIENWLKENKYPTVLTVGINGKTKNRFVKYKNRNNRFLTRVG
jgi:prophage antirepressor-like protein